MFWQFFHEESAAKSKQVMKLNQCFLVQTISYAMADIGNLGNPTREEARACVCVCVCWLVVVAVVIFVCV